MNCEISEAKLNYKRLGDYIQVVNIRNKNLEVETLLGVSIKKVLMPSIANTVGTDMSRYKIIEKNQFAYGPVTSRNGDKISIALLEEYDKALVSQAYTVFEIIDDELLNAEYLMMWFRRPEFDRYARFKSHGSARETFDWEELEETELPIPSIEKQRELVAEYNTIVNRIKLNETLNQKLEDTAQALYKHWFVDFEFPNAEGKPYKSSGGEMIYNEELDMEIPEIFVVSDLGSLLDNKGYIRGPFGSALKVADMRDSGIPVYEQQHVLDEHRNFRYYVDKDKFKSLERFSVKANDILISCSGVNLGKLSYVKTTDPIGIINQALLILRVDSSIISPICIKYFLSSKEGKRLLIGESGGSAIPNIAKREVIQAIPFLLPNYKTRELLESNLLVITKKTELINKEIDLLVETKNIILSKMSKVDTKTVKV
ncbi:restriction endonuclease subunit S [Winogradskyella arenosi]|uniref:Type I restriction enzyme S subunit n=1 Tax=Winogradskyella arenosi TaxID=533325 RepID=A0A368ZDI0_9FLAO|nr:restriction endonuclease subunit S [Winogradskyella arenosi]RCW91307.1 type I restriction enzyme S subunit [Winogradskyella arenosi]